MTKKEIKQRAKAEVEIWGRLIQAEQKAEIKKNMLDKYCQRIWLLDDLRLASIDDCVELIDLLVSYYLH